MLSTLLTVAALQVVVLVIPGPDVLLVSQSAIARSRRAALLAGAGVVLGIALWAALALMGVGTLFQHFPLVRGVIRVAGGLYLLVMAWGLWRSSRTPGTGGAVRLPPRSDPHPPRSGPQRSDLAAFRSGLLTNLSNPKAAVFFGSVFSSLLPAHSGSGLRLTVFALIVSLSACWFTLVALGMSTAPVQAAYLKARRRIDGVAGGLMAAFGVLLLAERQ